MISVATISSLYYLSHAYIVARNTCRYTDNNQSTQPRSRVNTRLCAISLTSPGVQCTDNKRMDSMRITHASTYPPVQRQTPLCRSSKLDTRYELFMG